MLLDHSATNHLPDAVLALLSNFHDDVHALLKSEVLVRERALKHQRVSARDYACAGAMQTSAQLLLDD
jgi:hypothetical protein